MDGKGISLLGRAAVVTGAGRGIGKSIALGFAENGADLVLTSRTLSEIESTANEINKMGRKALAIVCDVSKSTEIKNLARTAIDEFGKVDILCKQRWN